jgi:hypothetical protein
MSGSSCHVRTSEPGSAQTKSVHVLAGRLSSAICFMVIFERVTNEHVYVLDMWDLGKLFRLYAVTEHTVRWSNFDRRGPKMGVFFELTLVLLLKSLF